MNNFDKQYFQWMKWDPGYFISRNFIFLWSVCMEPSDSRVWLTADQIYISFSKWFQLRHSVCIRGGRRVVGARAVAVDGGAAVSAAVSAHLAARDTLVSHQRREDTGNYDKDVLCHNVGCSSTPVNEIWPKTPTTQDNLENMEPPPLLKSFLKGYL